SSMVKGNSVRLCLKWAFFAALAGPLSIFLHEVGHALMAVALGYTNVRITYHSVDRIAPENIQSWEKALTSEAGPIASLVIILLCFAIVLIRKHSIFAKALAMITAVQFVGGLIYFVGAMFGAGPPTDFDGARFAQYLDISIFFPSFFEALILVGTWLVFIRLISRTERVQAVIGTITGGVSGIIVWLTLLGPALLP
ncbi:MAG: hypothetical protein JSU58_00030, partial [Dehalococcoidales bacterium]